MRFLRNSEISDYTDKIWITQIFIVETIGVIFL